MITAFGIVIHMANIREYTGVSAEVWSSSQPVKEKTSPPLVPFHTPDGG